MDHDAEDQRNLRERLERVMYTHDSLNRKLKSLTSELSPNDIFNLSELIHEFQIKSDEIAKTSSTIQRQFLNRTNEDPKTPSITKAIVLQSDQNSSFEEGVERLEEDVDKLKSKLEEINNDNQKRTSLPQTTDNTQILPNLFFKQIHPSIAAENENELIPIGVEMKNNPEEEADAIVVIDSNTAPEISKKIHLSNNIVRWLRGPLKLTVNGIMGSFDLLAKGTHIRATVLEAVQRRITQQKQMTNNSFKSAFIEITSDWTSDGENSDKGFSSSTSWVRDPQGRRLLLKTQELPFGAVNEWLGYVLGNQLDLPVNEVQISVHENNLVTLHTDITQENEKTITLLEVPKEKRDKIMTKAIIESMDILDHILQNVDRNLRNILLTIPKTADPNDDNLAGKIRLIDHSSCFGMGERNFISIAAAKFHTNHLSIVKFDPIEKARQFEQYLNEIPIADRHLIIVTLNHFAAITDDQFDSWMTEMQDLLTPGQYNRIHSVLCRERDVTKRVIMEWNISPKSPNMESMETMTNA